MSDRIFRIVLIIANVICIAFSDRDNKTIKIFGIIGIAMLSISLLWT